MEIKIKQKDSISVEKWKMTSIGCTYYKVQDNDLGAILYANCRTDSNHDKRIKLNFTIQPRLESYLRATMALVREIANESKGHELVIGLVDVSKTVSLVAKELNCLGFEVNIKSPQELVGTRKIM